MRVIRLLDTFSTDELVDAVEIATQRETTDPAAIGLILERGEMLRYSAQPRPIDAAMLGESYPVSDLNAHAISDLNEDF
jgi:hypothetical protein